MLFENFMVLEFPSKSCNEDFARHAVADFVSQLDPTVEEISDIRTAVSEAVNNAIYHAYPDGLGMITVRCRILKDGVVDIVIKDKGVGIENTDKARNPMFSTVPERSGMGFTIMESFMTSLELKSELGKGTTVHMKRRIVPRRNCNKNK